MILLYNKFYFIPFRSLSSTADVGNQKLSFFFLKGRNDFFFRGGNSKFLSNRVSAAEAPFKFLRGTKYSLDTAQATH